MNSKTKSKNIYTKIPGCTLYLGDCLDVLVTLEDNSVDSVVVDPPAAISFMGKKWDSNKGGRDNWIAWMTQVASECLRVLKPGGHSLVWALPRTSHWTGMAWEDAGFETREKIYYCHGQGFPKSLDVSKAIDKAAGAEREVIGRYELPDVADGIRKSSWNCDAIDDSIFGASGQNCITAPATSAARRWQGWGTSLKPAIEEWILCRKPLSEPTVAANVLKWGTGALNIDACRVKTNGEKIGTRSTGGFTAKHGIYHGDDSYEVRDQDYDATPGRWPANFCHDGSPEVVKMFPHDVGGKWGKQGISGQKGFAPVLPNAGEQFIGNTGSAARFFKACPFDDDDLSTVQLVYMAKASRKDRDDGLSNVDGRDATFANGTRRRCPEHDACIPTGSNTYECGCAIRYDEPRQVKVSRNSHPCVKSTPLMRYLCRLITPPGGIVLDPLMGSGSTGRGAILEGFSFKGIEQEPDYFEIAKCRIKAASKRK